MLGIQHRDFNSCTTDAKDTTITQKFQQLYSTTHARDTAQRFEQQYSTAVLGIQHINCNSFTTRTRDTTHRFYVSSVELTEMGGGGWGRGRNQIIRGRESLVVYKSFNTLCTQTTQRFKLLYTDYNDSPL
jgi:hypothetical protein